MADKNVVFINNSKNPHRMKNAAGTIVMVQVGDNVELSPADALKMAKVPGFLDTSKYVKPSSELEALRKENAALVKENEELKEALKKAKK